MSSLAAWAGVDSRGPASFYLASDSRITWGLPSLMWDSGRKLFASSATTDIFGYCGEVLFPSLALGQFDNLLSRRVLVEAGENAADRHEVIRDVLERSFETYPGSVRSAFTILHAARDGSGMASRFRLWRLDWLPTSGWKNHEIEIPTESVLVLTVGSGAHVVSQWDREWRHRLGRTSRSVFGAFCDALKSNTDPRTGGAPQLVGLYRAEPARVFGVIWMGKRFVGGLEVPVTSGLESLEWRNDLFERCDWRTLQRLPEAQGQPRPLA